MSREPGREPLVTYMVDDHVAVITYNRPDKLNAINGALRVDLNEAWERFRADDDAWVAIVTGAGRAFCVGADLQDGAGAVGTWPGSFWEIPTVNSFESGMEIWKPTIAAVNGYCLGYGLTLVSACDFVIAADDAEFGMPEVRLGVPTIVGAIRLPHRVGMQAALEILLTGDRIDATRAHAIGLAGWVVPRAALLDEAMLLGRRLCQGAPLAVRAVKEMAYRGQYLPWVDAVRMGETMRRVAAQTEDAREGMNAAREGRPPRWTGK
jgi:enoyl-CoA hydratase/carnithine racemase